MNTISEVNNRIAYTAVVLNDMSKDKLIKKAAFLWQPFQV